jgi:hypothetical protein
MPVCLCIKYEREFGDVPRVDRRDTAGEFRKGIVTEKRPRVTIPQCNIKFFIRIRKFRVYRPPSRLSFAAEIDCRAEGTLIVWKRGGILKINDNSPGTGAL